MTSDPSQPLAALVIAGTPAALTVVQAGLARSNVELECRHVATEEQLAQALAADAWDIVLHCDADGVSPPRAVELVRRSGQDVPVMVVTEAIDDAHARALLDAGVRDVVRAGDWTWLEAAVRREHDDALTRTAHVESLRRAERREIEMAGLVAAAHEGVWVLEPSGRTRWASAHMAELLGLELESLLGRRVDDLVVGELPAGLHEAVHAGGDPPLRPIELELRRQGASDWWASLSVRALVHEDERRILLMVEDVTEHREQRIALGRANTMRALGELTAGITHDLGNVLSPLGLYLQVLETQGLSPAAEQTRAKMLGIVRRGQTMIERLRAFSRRRAEGASGPVDLAAQVEAAVELVRPRLKLREGISIELSARRDTVGYCEAGELVRAVVNLLVNAVDAMPEGGVIRVRVDQDGGGAWIEVEDEGTGMSPEIEARAFEPLFTTKEDGTGLGLSNVFGFVERTGGHVDLRTVVGVGTRVRMTLPRGPIE